MAVVAADEALAVVVVDVVRRVGDDLLLQAEDLLLRGEGFPVGAVVVEVVVEDDRFPEDVVVGVGIEIATAPLAIKNIFKIDSSLFL